MSILSNLDFRSNLLPVATYQERFPHYHILEVFDSRARLPNIFIPLQLTPIQQNESHRFEINGQGTPPEFDPRWSESLAAIIPDALSRLESAPRYEAALEILVVVRQLYELRTDSAARDEAASWDRRVVAVLGRSEFRLTPELVAERIDAVLGRKLAWPPALTPVAVPTSNVVRSTPIPSPTNPTTNLGNEWPAARLKSAMPTDPDLRLILEAWPTLPPEVKTCILLLVRAARMTAANPVE